MNKYIVSTSINDIAKTCYPLFVANHSDWTLVLVGDKKTDAAQYTAFVQGKNAIYLTPEDCAALYPELYAYYGPNTDLQRMLGIYYAYMHGADVIALVDDDNYPLSDWGKNLYVGREITARLVSHPNGVLDPVEVMVHAPNIWHRGFPIDRAYNKNAYVVGDNVSITPLVQSNLWMGEPDTDALCKLLEPKHLNVLPRAGEIFTSDVFSPFNTQNVVLARKAVPNFFMFKSAGRTSDIWGAYLLEAQYNMPVVLYGPPTVLHIRNVHDVIKDFAAEATKYGDTIKLIDALNKNKTVACFADFVSAAEWKLYLDYAERLNSVQ